MRLAPLLAALGDEDLTRLANEHVRTDERLPRPQLCNFLEGAVRSYRFVNDFIVNRQPPSFAMLTLLLDIPGYQFQRAAFREQVMLETRRLTQAIDAGELVARDDQLRLYRRAFYEARRSDLDVNSSEAALLSVLRRELNIAQVEHFLIEHHHDLREFWDKPDAFEHEENALRSAGLLFISGDMVVLPEEVAPAIRQALGVDMPTESARRLLAYLSNTELAGVLEANGSRMSGNKEARIDRIILERIQPHAALRAVGIVTLKEVCRETGASVTGSKEELIERVIAHFSQGKDQEVEEPVEPPLRESRRLSEDQFQSLFNALLQQELTDILRRFPDLRQAGTKETRVRTLWEAHLAEATLLSELMNRQLEDVLLRLGIRLSGSKAVRIERVIGHFSGASFSQPTSIASSYMPDVVTIKTDTHEVEQNQIAFKQKSSHPQASLQPWLDRLISANGLVRCYATEDANPTRQLKNKLSQAAAVQDGLLVLLLVDDSAFEKAREALLERWMTNAEWPKGVACVALAHPLGNAAIRLIVQRSPNPWATRIRSLIFPTADVLFASGCDKEMAISLPNSQCRSCGEVNLPARARFCPACGMAVKIGEMIP